MNKDTKKKVDTIVVIFDEVREKLGDEAALVWSLAGSLVMKYLDQFEEHDKQKLKGDAGAAKFLVALMPTLSALADAWAIQIEQHKTDERIN